MPAENAGLSRRLASMLYEGLVVFAVLLIGFLLPQVVLMSAGLHISPKTQWLHIFMLLMLYFVWFWINGGQTLAMKTWKLRIVDLSGRRLRPMQALLRYLAAWPSIALLGIGVLWALVDRDKLFLHDRIAGTRVVFEPPVKAS